LVDILGFKKKEVEVQVGEEKGKRLPDCLQILFINSSTAEIHSPRSYSIPFFLLSLSLSLLSLC